MAYTTVLWATLIDLSSVTHLMPEPFLQGLEVAAVLWVIAARRALNRTPQRLSNQDGIADTGAFRFVRHPICAGRAMLYGAFWMSNFKIQNTLILLSVYAVQLFQILRGERLLMKVPAYRDYAAKVRHRLVYELF